MLFPVVGQLHSGCARVAGVSHPMPRHGFAATQPFELREHAPDRAALVLHSNAVTRAAYPFEFELRVEYRAVPDGIDAAFTVHNAGDAPMPYAIGWHPGFRWPFSQALARGHAIEFEQQESPWVPVIVHDGLFSAARRPVPLQGRRLPLQPALFDNEALCFLNARSRALRFGSPDNAAIAVRAQHFAHWALWCPPGAPLLCIEAWTGHGDAPDFDGELAERPSMRRLQPGQTGSHRVELRFEPAEHAP